MSKIKQMSFFDSVHELYQYELYDEIVFLDELVPVKSRGSLTPKHEGLLGAYIGEAYYQLERYNLAFQNYRDALEVYIHCPRAILLKNFTEADIRYRFHRVLLKLRRFDEAIQTLKAIPDTDAPLKIKAALAKLLLARDGASVNPTCYYESIMKACSSALHATSHLLKNGIIGLEVIPTPTALKNIPQVQTFLESQSLLARKQSREAVDLLLNLSDCSFRMLVEAGYLLYNVGNDEAKHVLLRAHRLEPERVTLMDTLSYLLFLEPVYHPELESLAIGLMKEDPNSAEAQISFGYLTRTLGKSYRSKALQMAFSACQINQYSNRPKTQALLLKTGILVDMDKGEEASKTISEAIKFDPHNFDFQRALVNSYLSKSKIREARTWLSNITIARPNEPRVQILRAQVLLKSGTQVGRNEAQKLLEQAVQDDPHQMEGVWTLADVYEKNGKFDVACAFLKNLSQGSYNSANLGRMHQLLGELLTKCQEPGQAYVHVNRALSNGVDEALSQIPNLEGVIYQTPSPLAPVARQPQAPRRNRPSRQNSDMDSSAEFNNSNNQSSSQ